MGSENDLRLPIVKLEFQHAIGIFNELVRIKNTVCGLSRVIRFVTVDNLLGEIEKRVKAVNPLNKLITILTVRSY